MEDKRGDMTVRQAGQKGGTSTAGKHGASFYREIGRREGITKVPQDKIMQDRSGGFDSDRFRGGEYSIQGTRVPLETVTRERPRLPRKVLGELVVLKVEKGTSVALITRTTAEVQIGDRIERSN